MHYKSKLHNILFFIHIYIFFVLLLLFWLKCLIIICKSIHKNPRIERTSDLHLNYGGIIRYYLLTFKYGGNLKVTCKNTYTAGINVSDGSFLAVNHHNHKNWVPFIPPLNLWLIFMGMKYFFSFETMNSKWPTQKNWAFQNHQFSFFFSCNFWWPSKPLFSYKPSWNTLNWPKDQSLKFSWKNIEDWRFWKTQFFWVGHFEFLFFRFFFCFIPIKVSHKLYDRMNGTQFLWLWWFTAKNDPPKTLIPVYLIPLLILRECIFALLTEGTSMYYVITKRGRWGSENSIFWLHSLLKLITKGRIRIPYILILLKGPYFNYVSMFLTIFDQINNLVSMFTKEALFTKLAFWPIFLTNYSQQPIDGTT